MNTPPTQPAWPASQTFWRDKRVIVTGPSATLRTGGSGFLGSFVVDKLHARGAAEACPEHSRRMIVPRRADYDPSTALRTCLRDIQAIRQLFADVQASAFRIPHSALYVIHLAAHVGGIGANRARPAEFFGACPELAEGTT